MAAEIERKFLVRTPPADLPPGDAVAQGYVALDPAGAEVRVRRRGGAWTLTAKTGRGRVRGEEEIVLDAEAGARLWALTQGRRLEKTRHLVPLDGALVAELDVYRGALAGLVVVEVEFASEDAADAFVPPPWFGEDVTGDDRYGNARLAVDGAP